MKKLDENHLRMLAGDDNAAVIAIIKGFIGDAKQILRDCVSAVEAGNEGELKRLLHKLKGSSGSLGFMECYRSCIALEECVLSENCVVKIAELEISVDASAALALDLLG